MAHDEAHYMYYCQVYNYVDRIPVQKEQAIDVSFCNITMTSLLTHF